MPLYSINSITLGFGAGTTVIVGTFYNTGIPRLALLTGSRKTALSETALSEGTFSIRINVNLICTLNVCFNVN
jgi:hypothetical protein